MAHLMHPVYRRGFMPQGINQHPGFVADLKESFKRLFEKVKSDNLLK